MRSEYGIPVGSASDVALVQDAGVCESVATSLEAKGWPVQSGTFAVVRIGQNSPFYVAARPTTSVIQTAYLLNSQFIVLTEFGH
jgi:hypothetical protein